MEKSNLGDFRDNGMSYLKGGHTLKLDDDIEEIKQVESCSPDSKCSDFPYQTCADNIC